MNSEDQLKRIQEKLQVLIRQHQQLTSENQQLKIRLQESSSTSEEHRDRIDELEQRLSVLKATAGTMTGSDKKDLEKRLNHYLKEIDRCISMLSE